MSGNPAAIHLLEKNPDKIYWRNLSHNPAAIHLLEKNQDNINWFWLSKNPSPGAVHLLEQHLDKVDWYFLSENPAATHLILKYDYEKMKENCDPLFKEITEYVFNPKRLMRFAERYNIEFIDLVEIY